jgi:hypothetical protein
VGDVRTENLPTVGVSAQRSVTAAVGGAFIVVCAATVASAVAVSNWVLASGGPGLGWDYPPLMWPLLLTLAGAGVMVMTQHRWARAAALLSAIVAAQLAGLGLIAVRAWFAIRNYGGQEYLTVTPITYAAVVALVASGAAVASAAMVWREPASDWRSLVPARPVYVAAGVAVMVFLPQTWNAAGESGDITGLRNIATLTYALPWGVGLAAVGFMRGRSATVAGVTVAVFAVLCAVFGVAAQMFGGYATLPASD